MSRPALTASDVTLAYPDSPPLLSGVRVALERGRLYALLGRNGSGKTTLLRCLLGAMRPMEGSVTLDGRPLREWSPRERARRLAYVPQQTVSAFAFSALDIVLMGRWPHQRGMGFADAHDIEVARSAMVMTHCEHLADRPFGELSGGEAQCVAIARALAQQPTVLLLDEPTSHLDLHHNGLIHHMMRRVAHDWNIAVLWVTHEVNLAARFADEWLVLAGGRVRAQGAPGDLVRADLLGEVFETPIRLIPCEGEPPLVLPEG